MYWYMTTKTSSLALLTDETWAQISPMRPDRRAVGAASLVLMLLLAAIGIGASAGILEPHLTHDGGSTIAVARTNSITVHAVIHNDSARSWTITGATINAPGTVEEMETTKVTIPAHKTRTVSGAIHVDNCGAVRLVRSNQESTSYDIKLRIERLLGASTFTIDGVSGDQLARVCSG